MQAQEFFSENLKDISIVECKDYEMKFILENATNELAALFRKIMMIKVPTMAIYPVQVYKNTTMYDTFSITRKLRFLPLRINPTRYIFPDECECVDILKKDKTYTGELIGGCDNCSCMFSLIVSGNEKIKKITSKDIWCKDYNNLFDDTNAIDILSIKNKEELLLTCRAFKGCGEMNAMWSPVTVVTFSKISKDDETPQYNENQKYEFYFESVGSLKAMNILKKTNEIYQKEKLRLSIEEYEFRHRYLSNEHL